MQIYIVLGVTQNKSAILSCRVRILCGIAVGACPPAALAPLHRKAAVLAEEATIVAIVTIVMIATVESETKKSARD